MVCVNPLMVLSVQEKGPVTVESASVLLRNGIFPGNSVNAMTETVTSTRASSAQEMVCVTVGTVTAGKDGQEMPVKSGLE